MSATEVKPAQTADEAAAEALKRVPRAAKLEAFFQLCQAGKDVATALHASGLVAPMGYDPTAENAEIEIEELFYGRCAAKVSKLSPYGVIPDMDWDQSKVQPGDLKTSQLYALVDWLYFVRALPIIAIGKALQLPAKIIQEVKAALSNDFAKSIRMQHADGYIADLLRLKDLLRADLVVRRAQLGVRDAHAAVRIDQLIWELENRFVDRLQEIGIIDKNLGRIEVNEEWHVTVDAVSGAPSNKKLNEVSQEPFVDAEVLSLPGDTTSNELADPQSAVSTDGDILLDEPNAEQLLRAVSKVSATIKVGQD